MGFGELRGVGHAELCNALQDPPSGSAGLADLAHQRHQRLIRFYRDTDWDPVRARAREIALYRVLGMTPRQVRRLVLMEGAFIGLLGGCLAVLLGVPLGYTAIGALRAVSAFEVSFALPPSYVLFTIAGAVLISTGASLLPALRAARAGAATSLHQE